MTCVLCSKLELIKENNFKFIIHEFKNSYWILGDHQFFKGYSQIIFKDHVRDLHELSKATQRDLFMEVMEADKISRLTLSPWKMNLSLYGNAVPHIHWHLFPRYENEVDCKKVPWTYMNDFDSVPTEKTDYHNLIQQFRKHLEEA
ncbi:MAG: HIT family protein [Bacteriovoracaceae bacterium]